MPSHQINNSIHLTLRHWHGNLHSCYAVHEINTDRKLSMYNVHRHEITFGQDQYDLIDEMIMEFFYFKNITRIYPSAHHT